MSWGQLVQPDTSVQANAGMCLAFAQAVYGAPVRYRSAWEAWEATTDKHSEELPPVSVPVWFSHYGTYGNPPSYENWGHVVAYIPGQGFLSSPGQGYGHEWLGSIGEVEARFNSSYVGWSTDINGLAVAVNNGDEMTPEQAQKLNAIYDALFKKTTITAATTGYKDITGGVLNVLSHMTEGSAAPVAVDYNRIIQGVADELSKRLAD